MKAVSCPSCHTDNPSEARQCSACGTRLAPRTRRRRPPDNGDSLGSDLGNETTRLAFRCAAFGLIPLAGLVLGPVAVVLSLLAYRKEKAGPPREGKSPALAVLLLAVLILVTNWVGVALMVYGLRSAGYL